MPSTELYIGLMSGTSMDGIDAVLVDFGRAHPQLIASHSEAIPAPLLAALHQLANPNEGDINLQGRVDVEIAGSFAKAVKHLLAKADVSPQQVRAIGSHGQTIRHMPHPPQPFTLQIGDGNSIAVLTGIDTIADFRRKDIALGGQGAPLVPAFHQQVFEDNQKPRLILNIGGIANITWLPGDETQVLGFDTGPGNTLMDHWCQQHQNRTYDDNGQWAASGTVNQALLTQLISHPYFSAAAPKSTGRELFNPDWLHKQLHELPVISPQDVQATLCQFTVECIAREIEQLASAGELYVCGGGVYNQHLMTQLTHRLPQWNIATTATIGIDPQWVEAMAFAWLAQRHVKKLPGNLPAVTGASKKAILGAFYPAG